VQCHCISHRQPHHSRYQNIFKKSLNKQTDRPDVAVLKRCSGACPVYYDIALRDKKTPPLGMEGLAEGRQWLAGRSKGRMGASGTSRHTRHVTRVPFNALFSWQCFYTYIHTYTYVSLSPRSRKETTLTCGISLTEGHQWFGGTPPSSRWLWHKRHSCCQRSCLAEGTSILSLVFNVQPLTSVLKTQETVSDCCLPTYGSGPDTRWTQSTMFLWWWLLLWLLLEKQCSTCVWNFLVFSWRWLLLLSLLEK